MPDQPEVLTVSITRLTEDPNKCRVEPPFKAKPGSEVNFVSDIPNAQIVFERESPFASLVLSVGRQRIKSDALRKNYAFTVTWPGGGQGNGSGVVP